MTNEFENLLCRYWDLAYLEGKSGISQGDKANEVLSALKKLAEQPAQQEPVGYEHHEYRPYGAPGEVRIHAVLASQYKMPDGAIADDFKWLIDGYKADPNTIKLLPFYTSPPAQQCKWPTCQREDYQQALAEQIKRDLVGEQPAQSKPLTIREIGVVCGNFSDETIKVVRQTEAAHGIKENT